MSAPQKCPKCRAELPEDAPAGLCPNCLVAVGLEGESEGFADRPTSDPDAPTIDSPAPSFVPPDVADIADKFPQLEIRELHGRGGMGAVYKALQINLDRLVALKIIRPEASYDSAFAERFNREAKTLARLSHQHIVAIHDFGEVQFSRTPDGPSRPLYYFVMEFVDGANLRELIRHGELTAEQALAIVPQICEALQFAHDEGVVHRDIKPENILLDKNGRVKIADFGLAKLANTSPEQYSLTQAHQVMGTPRYMAPEQMEGSHAVDHRADIYSLGVVFYEMLTGEVPAGHFDPPSKKVEIDVRLDEVVLRSMAREPERRYQHASDVKTDVDSISGAALPKRPLAHLPDSTSIHPTDAPRFSGKAILGCLMATVFLMMTVPAYVVARSSAIPVSIGLSLLIICTMSGPVSCLLGMIALSDIRHSYGRITGLGLAFIDAIFFPLLLLDALVYGLSWLIIEAFDERSSPDYSLAFPIPIFALLITFFICAPLDIWIAYRAWRAATRHVADHPDTRGMPEKLRNVRIQQDVTPDDEEQQREAELSEIAPDWLCWRFIGMFAAGWIVVGLLWNFRWPGLVVAIGVLAAITYYAVQLKLRYLPRLQSELGRESHWSRITTLAFAMVLFVPGVLCVVWFQASTGDLLTRMQMLGGPRALADARMTDEQRSTVLESAHLTGLGKGEVELHNSDFGFTVNWIAILLAATWGLTFLFFSVASLIHTRRYRYTWKHWWQPTIAITFYLLGMLLTVHGIHFFFVGYGELKAEGREIRCDAGCEAVDAVLEDWKQQAGYTQSSYDNWKMMKEDIQIGTLHGRQLIPVSWFDRYQASWRHMVIRPRPQLSLTIVSQLEPPQTFVEVKLPHQTKGSPEATLWKEIVDGLEEAIVSAADDVIQVDTVIENEGTTGTQ